MKRILREPLLHFLILGAVLFGVYAWVDRGRGGIEPSRQIQLSLDDLSQLALLFQAQWRRQPTEEEFRRMVENKVQEEVLYREGLAMGLDKDDEAGRISAGHGDGRHARISRCAAPRCRIRDRRLGDRARNRSRIRITAFAGHRGACRWVLRNLPRPCARYRATARPERIALQPGFRDRDRMPARGRDRHRHGPPRPWGRQLLRVAGTAVAAGGAFFMWKACT